MLHWVPSRRHWRVTGRSGASLGTVPTTSLGKLLGKLAVERRRDRHFACLYDIVPPLNDVVNDISQVYNEGGGGDPQGTAREQGVLPQGGATPPTGVHVFVGKLLGKLRGSFLGSSWGSSGDAPGGSHTESLEMAPGGRI